MELHDFFDTAFKIGQNLLFCQYLANQPYVLAGNLLKYKH